MKTGFRIELSGDELSTIITACGVRLRELGNGIEKAQKTDDEKSVNYLLEKYHELHAVVRILENAEFFVEMGA